MKYMCPYTIIVNVKRTKQAHKQGRKKERKKIMTNIQMKETVNELLEMEALLEETKAIVEGLKDSLKAELVERNVESIDLDEHIVRYVNVISNRFDSTNFKKQFPEMYKEWTKAVPSKRFSIS